MASDKRGYVDLDSPPKTCRGVRCAGRLLAHRPARITPWAEAPRAVAANRVHLPADISRAHVAPTTLGGMGAGAANALEHDFMARRFSMNPPPGAVEVRRDVERSIHAASGIPPVLVGHTAPG